MADTEHLGVLFPHYHMLQQTIHTCSVNKPKAHITQTAIHGRFLYDRGK